MKVLVVDDNEVFARLSRTKLESWGHTVSVVSSNEAARRLFEREPFRVVILDWSLPDTTGGELCRFIRSQKQRRYTYIIVYFDAEDRDRMVEAFEAGANDYLIKPFSPVELRLHLKNCQYLLDLEDELREGAATDVMTGLVNFESFRQFFRIVVAESRRTETLGTLMFFHVSNYRSTFETHGYKPAERMMVEVARILGDGARDSDLVARMAEGSFCLMLQNTFWDRCKIVAEKLLQRIQYVAIVDNDIQLRPDVRIEVVNYPQANLSADQILMEAPRLAIAA